MLKISKMFKTASDIPTDNGSCLWLDYGSDNYVLILGQYFLEKHGESKEVAGGTILGWKTREDIYGFFKSHKLELKRGFQTISTKPGANKDTVVNLTPAEVSSLNPKDLSIASKNNFSVPGLPENMCPVVNRPSTPASEFQVLMFPTDYKYMAGDEDFKTNPEAVAQAQKLEAAGKTLWVIVTMYPGKAAPSGNRDDKGGWLHPENGKIVGTYAFTRDSVQSIQPWPESE